jgi:gluconolactonase
VTALSPDNLWLVVAESKTHWGYSYRVRSDGGVDSKQRFYWFHEPDDADASSAGSMAMDREGRLYVSTNLGVQVFDRSGRSRLILPASRGAVRALSPGNKEKRQSMTNAKLVTMIE